MSYTPVEIPRFGGLNLSDDPQEAGMSAIDMLNVDLDTRGRVRTRDGYAKLTGTPATNRLWRLSFVGSHLFAADMTSNKYAAYSTGGAATLSSAIANFPPYSAFVGFASPSSSTTYAYAGTGTATNNITRWDGASFTYPATGYSGTWAAVQTPDNRLVLVDAHDSAGTGYRVRFSNAGAPETFSANDYVDLSPNDGDLITGVATYRDQLIVFKSTKFFVFYGTTTDASGNPVFNYRMVDVGKGCVLGACCSSPDGVYFHDKDGIYLTRGDAPVKVSSGLDPLFRAKVPSAYSGSYVKSNPFGQSYPSLCWYRDRLFFATATGTSTYQNRMFVLDRDLGWLVWDIPAAGLAVGTSPAGSTLTDTLYFTYATGTNDIGYLSPSATTDAGTAITSHYRTGCLDLGIPGGEKVVREWLLDGYGAPTVKVATNDGSLGSGAAVTLGTSPAVAQGRDRRAVRGRNFSLELSGSSAWSVSRVVANVVGQRSPAARAS